MANPRSVDEAIARFDEIVARYDGSSSATLGASSRRYARSIKSAGKRIANIGIALVALIIATIGFGLFVGPIGWTGLFLVAIATLFVLIFFSIWPVEPARLPYSEQLPTKTVVRQLDTYLSSQRAALPAPAARSIDAISAQLPLLESKLDQVDLLDPLAQDARRLMGKHLPELIERYERIPANFRTVKDGGGLTVDERLLTGLDAARAALDDIGARLARDDLTAFETQGRFIESRYKDDEGLKGD